MLKYWLAIILGVLGLLGTWFFGCHSAPAPAPVASSTTAPAAVKLEPGALNFALVDGKARLGGIVPDQATKDRLIATTKQVYGADNVVDALEVRAVDPGKVILSGVVPAEADRTMAQNTLTKALAANVVIENQIKLNAPSVAETQKAKIDETLKLDIVEFATGSATLTPKGKQTLDKVSAALSSSGNTKVEIQGHTDNVGQEAANIALSQARADSTLHYLVSKGIAAARMSAKGYGPNKPIADNATREGRQRNRRIDFDVSEGK